MSRGYFFGVEVTVTSIRIPDAPPTLTGTGLEVSRFGCFWNHDTHSVAFSGAGSSFGSLGALGSKTWRGLVKMSSPSARSGDLLGNGEMLVMRTIEDPANPICQLVSSQQSVGFDYFALAVHPLGLYGVQPRTPLWQKATHNPHTFTALLDFSVVFS